MRQPPGELCRNAAGPARTVPHEVFESLTIARSDSRDVLRRERISTSLVLSKVERKL
jgi:hypothetical protein